MLRRTAEKIGNAPGYDSAGHSPQHGFGRVDARRAVDAVVAGDTGDGGSPAERPSIVGPRELSRSDPPPVFSVSTGGNRLYAVEVAARWQLFDGSHDAERTPDVFFGSWQAGPLLSDPTYRLPADAWARLRAAELRLPPAAWARLRTAPRLWFRVLASEVADGWAGVAASVPGDRVGDAPFIAVVDVGVRAGEASPEQVDRVWRSATDDARVAALSRREGATGAVVRHLDRAGRPRAPGDVSWLVLVSAPATGGVEELVARLREPDLVLESVEATVSAEQAVEARGLPAVETDDDSLTSAVTARPGLWADLGAGWVWQDLGPPPVEGVGGTVLVSRRTGRLLFASPTTWRRRVPVDP